MSGNPQAAYTMAAELSMGAAALAFLLDQPGRWDEFVAFGMEANDGRPLPPPALLERPRGAAAAVALLRLANYLTDTAETGGIPR